MTLFEKCLKFAIRKHSGQLDKIDNPYILHPMRVAANLTLTTETQRCIAILHDVFEDCEVTSEELSELDLPDDILESLTYITHEKNEHDIDYWNRILTDPTGNARLVKLADIDDNSLTERMKKLPVKDINRLLSKYRHAHFVLNYGYKPHQNL